MFIVSIRSKKANVYETLDFYTRDSALDYASFLRRKYFYYSPNDWVVSFVSSPNYSIY